jgi:hypothetical protein
MANVILDNLPNCIVIDGEEIPIYTDFKNWLEFNRVLNKRELMRDDIVEAFSWVLPEFPQVDADLVADELIKFMVQEEEEEKRDDEPLLMKDVVEVEEPYKPPVFDYDFDSGYVYSAFLQQYGINLRHTDMHWFEFKALFNGLTDNVKLTKIIGYRAVGGAEYGQMSKSERKHINEMKKIYALPDKRTQEEKEADFVNGL